MSPTTTTASAPSSVSPSVPAQQRQIMMKMSGSRPTQLPPLTRKPWGFPNNALLVGRSDEDPTEDPTDHSEHSVDDWSEMKQHPSSVMSPWPPSSRRQHAVHRQGSTQRNGIATKSKDGHPSVQKHDYSQYTRSSSVKEMQAVPITPKSRAGTNSTNGRSQVSPNRSQQGHMERMRDANTKIGSKAIELPFCKEEKRGDFNKMAGITSTTKEEERRKAKLLSWNSKYEMVKKQVPHEEKVMIMAGRGNNADVTSNSPDIAAFMAPLQKAHEERISRAKHRISMQRALAEQQAQERNIRMATWNAKYEALDASALETKLNQTAKQREENTGEPRVEKANKIRHENVQQLVRQKSAQQLWIRNQQRLQRLEQATERIRQKEELERKEAEKRGKHILEWNSMYEGVTPTATTASN